MPFSLPISVFVTALLSGVTVMSVPGTDSDGFDIQVNGKKVDLSPPGDDVTGRTLIQKVDELMSFTKTMAGAAEVMGNNIRNAAEKANVINDKSLLEANQLATEATQDNIRICLLYTSPSPRDAS